MKKINFIILFLLSSMFLSGQTNNFNIDAYNIFLQNNQNMSAEQLLNMHDAEKFKNNINSNWNDALYHDSVKIKYGLTEDEISLINKNGFVVTERVWNETFGMMLADIYHKDLPVFVTTDMILHAFHYSYDKILIDVERGIIIDRLKELLEKIHSNIPNLESRYSTNEEMQDRIKDVDLYLTVPRKLLGEDISPYYSSNLAQVNDLLQFIDEEQLQNIPFFSEVPRKIDFSQFKPRGHYDDIYNPELGMYFKTMIWLGRMELYLIAPNSLVQPTFEDVQRQAVISYLIQELIEISDAQAIYNEIEEVIEAFVGEQDNTTLSDLLSLKETVGFLYCSELLDSAYFKSFQDTLSTKDYAAQKILSQVLIQNPYSPDSIRPASAFMLFGQRFVIDSYITGSVVFDRIKAKRMLPSTLDVLFGLGNDAAAQLLVDELNEYKYSSNLAALRYLVDSYENDFWESTIYNGWLNSIRDLNPPTDRTYLPEFMQTAAWWQQKMNTQLSSWTELRHDNLLYAKQSYSGIPVCSYPYSYVEPFPEFYNSMKTLAINFKEKITDLNFSDEYLKQEIFSYLDNLYTINDTLETIAYKELNGMEFTNEEILFLKKMMNEEMAGCVTGYNGWYTKLYYKDYGFYNGLNEQDFIVADYHTSPSDANGAMVGWVAHAGTGEINLSVITAELPNGEMTAFVGPVMSYHEFTTDNFFRITDDEWTDTYLNSSSKPAWTNIYLADTQGKIKGDGPTLVTSIDQDDNSQSSVPVSYLIAQNYPNPFNPSTTINFTIPAQAANKKAKLTIYDLQGGEIITLVNEPLQAGNYFIRWNGTNSSGNHVASGIYFYDVRAGDQKYIGKMNLIK